MVTFGASAGALLFFCLCSYCARRNNDSAHPYAWRAPASLSGPLLRSDEESLRDTMVEEGLGVEWECWICHFSNAPSKDICIMCGSKKTQNDGPDAPRGSDHGGGGGGGGGGYSSVPGGGSDQSRRGQTLSFATDGIGREASAGSSASSPRGPAGGGGGGLDNEQRERSFAVKR
jgi:hypothetical protein